MKLLTVAGPPACGKTSVVLKLLSHLQPYYRLGVVKFDCLQSEDGQRYAEQGLPVRQGLAGGLCPDHYFAANIDACVSWAQQQGLELLVTESAGLCSRCSPHISQVLSLCVLDNLSGIGTPRKLGPMLDGADLVVITKGDVVSQAEREIYAAGVRQVNPQAQILHVNGINGQGSLELAGLCRQQLVDIAPHLEGHSLRCSMPSAMCSYCLGETRLGKAYQKGNVRTMNLQEAPA